jgi:TM2 domain-containing membrane protein YozV
MKKIALLIVTTILVFACVRKQNLTEPEGTLAEYANHCYNGTLDGDEISVDCGGECGPCNFAQPTCSTGTNILKIGASSTYTLTGYSCGAPNNDFIMDATYSNGNVTVEIDGAAPDMSATYTAVNSSIPGYHEVYIRCTTSGLGTLVLNSGSVFFSQNNGKYMVTICGGSAYSFNTASNHTVTGNFSCP